MSDVLARTHTVAPPEMAAIPRVSIKLGVCFYGRAAQLRCRTFAQKALRARGKTSTPDPQLTTLTRVWGVSMAAWNSIPLLSLGLTYLSSTIVVHDKSTFRAARFPGWSGAQPRLAPRQPLKGFAAFGAAVPRSTHRWHIADAHIPSELLGTEVRHSRKVRLSRGKCG